MGVVQRKDLIDGSAILPGDSLIGLASTGLHSNGFSLVRKVVFESAGRLYRRDLPDGRPLRLTGDEGRHFEYDPSWSRDGKSIVFVTWSDGSLGQVHQSQRPERMRRQIEQRSHGSRNREQTEL